MKLKFVGPEYKSVSELMEADLPNFVILTGRNGIGKTHLLKAIESGSITVDDVHATHATSQIRYYEHGSLAPNPSSPVIPPNIGAMIEESWTTYKTAISNLQRQMSRGIGMMQTEQTIRALLSEVGWENATLETLTTHANRELAVDAMNYLKKNAEGISTSLGFVKSIAAKRGKDNLFGLTKEDFLNAYPTIRDAVDPFQQSFSTLFASYSAHRYRNEFEEFRHIKRGSGYVYLTEAEFLALHGTPPWERVDAVLKIAGLPLKVIPPPEEIYRSYEAKLQHEVSGKEIAFSELSSGERIICALALAMYYASEPQQPVNYPSLLLLDEIDATLHPPYVAAALRVVEQIIVKNGVKVIMTTHSPTTVALAPTSSVHVLERTQHLTIRAISKSQAIGTLLKGVPTISVDHEHRRQIVVEDDSDVTAYEQLYSILSPILNPDISLTFVPATVTNVGGDASVIRILEAFKDNRKVFGLLDWDGKRSPNNNILVLGHNRRYTLENFLLDPIAVGAFLLQEAIVTPEDLSLPPGTTYSRLIGTKLLERKEIFQLVANAVLERVKLNVAEPMDETRKAHAYGMLGEEFSIELPEWFCLMNGHTWTDHLIDRCYPKLGAFKSRRGEKSLVFKILTRIYSDQPTLIPTEVRDLFVALQAT